MCKSIKVATLFYFPVNESVLKKPIAMHIMQYMNIYSFSFTQTYAQKRFPQAN